MVNFLGSFVFITCMLLVIPLLTISRYLQERGSRTDALLLLEAAQRAAEAGTDLIKHESSGTVSESQLGGTSLRSYGGSDDLREELSTLLCDVTNARGCIEMARSRFHQAAQHFNASIKLRKTMTKVDEPMIYTTKNLGYAYLSDNHVDEAYIAFQESMEMREQQLSNASDPDAYRDHLALNLGSLSLAEMALGKLDAAWNTAMKSTELCTQVHQPESPVMSKYADLVMFNPFLIANTAQLLYHSGKNSNAARM